MAREEKDYGLLGRRDIDDFAKKFEQSFRLTGNINISEIFNIASSLMNELTKSLNDSHDFPRGINITFSCKKPAAKIERASGKESCFSSFSEEKLRRYSKLSKTEPKTDIRRIGKKLLYKLEMPDVKNSEDIMISKFENSFEIRAIGDNAYFKIIPLKLELLKWSFKDGTLILEFKD